MRARLRVLVALPEKNAIGERTEGYSKSAASGKRVCAHERQERMLASTMAGTTLPHPYLPAPRDDAAL